MKTIKRGLFWGLVLFSIVSLVFTPFASLKSDITRALPWVAVGVVVSEVLFTIGLVVMATSIGVKIRNPFKLRRELKRVLLASTATWVFWVGFWINASGAVGTMLLLGAGILVALPMTSWGLLWVPVVDLAATIAIRQWALRAHARERGLV